jgi:hypothetical protein
MKIASAACALSLALAGCSGVKTYPDDIAAKNLSIRTASSGARAALGIHSVDAQCRTQYLGTVALDKSSVALGIPAERWSYLVFDFATSRYLGSQRGRISRETLLKPRAGYRYEIDVTYRDDLYDVVIREQPPRGKARELEFLDLGSCAK